MTGAVVKARRDYWMAGYVNGAPVDERVRALRRVDFGVPGVWVLVRGEDGRRVVTHAGHLRGNVAG